MKSAYPLVRNITILSGIFVFFCMVSGQTEDLSFTIGTIKINGLKSYKTSDVFAAGGLSIGQKVKVADLDTAAKKMADTGAFSSVGYEYRIEKLKMDLEFQVEEARDFLPCIFDNFVWFRNEELIESIRAKMPLFNGMLSRSGIALPRAIEALQDLLRTHQIAGNVRSMPKVDLDARKALGFIISVTDYPIPIRSIQFRNSNGIPEAELQEKCKPILEQQYSKIFVAEFVQRNLAALFQQKGYLRVKFQNPESAILTDPKPGTPVAVTVGVIEGVRYQWDRALWTGESSIAMEELDRIVGLKTGDVANGIKIDAGIKAVAAALNQKGYIEARAQAVPEFNDTAGTVLYKVQITQGAQYTMGSVTFKGVTESILPKLQAKWKLQTGTPFDPTYAGAFLKQEAFTVTSLIRPKTVKTLVVPNRSNLTVNVIFDFN
jgi:outer membrane protein insertion porin family